MESAFCPDLLAIGRAIRVALLGEGDRHVSGVAAGSCERWDPHWRCFMRVTKFLAVFAALSVPVAFAQGPIIRRQRLSSA